MDRIIITGGRPLRGVIPISGAKNAALPLMIASLLTSDTLTLENVPHLADVEQLVRILGNHGVDIAVNGRRERQTDGYSRERSARILRRIAHPSWRFVRRSRA